MAASVRSAPEPAPAIRGEVQPGDLVLVRTPRRAYQLGRWLGRSSHDHIGVVISGGRVLNVVRPLAVATPLERMLSPSRAPLVLRPPFPDDAARAQFVAALERLLGKRYAVRRAVRLVAAMIVKQRAGVLLPLPAPDVSDEAWICTDAVLLYLTQHFPEFAGISTLPLDWNDLRCGSTDDFLVIAGERPDLLRRVEPPSAR